MRVDHVLLLFSKLFLTLLGFTYLPEEYQINQNMITILSHPLIYRDFFPAIAKE